MEGYTATVESIEPTIWAIDASAFYASAAISLKRIADAMEARNRLLALDIQQREVSDNDKHDDWLVQHRLDDLIEDADRRDAARKRVLPKDE